MAAAETEAEARLPIPTRSLPEIMGAILDGRINDIRTAFPGKVNSFNSSKKTVEVSFQLDLGQDEVGNDLTPPPIPGVPVLFPGTYWDVQPGETGLVLVTWKNMQNWLLTGALQPPEDTGVHELSSCCFLPGLWPFPTAQTIDLDDGAKVIPLQSGLSWLLLADNDADEPLIRGDAFFNQLDTVLGFWSTWVGAVSLATGVPGAQLQGAIDALKLALPAYLSNQVFIPGAGP